MKIHGKRFLCTLLVFAAVFTMLSSCSHIPDKKRTIAVITKSTDADFWHNVEKGVNSAAAEYNVDVSFTGPENEEDYVTQNEMIRDAVSRGVDAIVLSAIDCYKSSDVVESAVNAGIYVVMIDSNVDTDKTSMFIGTDNYAAGRSAGECAAEHFGSDEKLYFGLVNYAENTDNGIQRENGLRDYVESLENAEIVATVHVDSNTTSATAGAITMLQTHPEINVIVGFNEWTTLGVGYAIRQTGLADKVCAVGFDTNVVSIGMLENGEMDALIVQSPFAMGYLGVFNAVNLIDGKHVEKTIYTTATVITSENMFDENSQKSLFQFE